MRKILGLAAISATALGASSPAIADVVFLPGNSPQPGQESVLFPIQGPETTVIGNSTTVPANSLSLSGATTTGTQFLVDSLAVEPASGLITSLTITPSSPLDFLIVNTTTGSGTLTYSAHMSDGFVAEFNLALGNGQNFVTIDAINGESIEYLTLSAPGGFTDIRQFAAIFLPAIAVPEPDSWAMILLGFGAVGFALRRRKQTQSTFRRAAYIS
jgi:hypothetical protein